MRPVRILLVALTAALPLAFRAPAAGRAASPADQYVMFVTDADLLPSPTNPIPPTFPLFGSIEAADYWVNQFAFAAGLFDWDGSILFKAVMSKSTAPAVLSAFW